MRIKTVPRHRIVQRSMKIASATKCCPDEETAAKADKDDVIYVIDDQDSPKVNESYIFHELYNFEKNYIYFKLLIIIFLNATRTRKYRICLSVN